jgi:hypothetical protein
MSISITPQHRFSPLTGYWSLLESPFQKFANSDELFNQSLFSLMPPCLFGHFKNIARPTGICMVLKFKFGRRGGFPGTRTVIRLNTRQVYNNRARRLVYRCVSPNYHKEVDKFFKLSAKLAWAYFTKGEEFKDHYSCEHFWQSSMDSFSIKMMFEKIRY